MSDRVDERPGSHDAIRARVLAMSAGLLSEVEAAEVRAHAEGCPDCAELVAALAESSEAAPDSGHLPAELLSDWPAAASSMRGFEREMVRRHLARCPECREDLQVLGYAPQLPDDLRDAVTEPGSRPVAARSIPDLAEERRKRADARAWVLGGWAVVATAAALALVFGQGPIGPPSADGPAPVPVPGPPTDRTPIPAPPRAEVVDFPAAIVLRSPLRSAGNAVPFGAADPSRRYLCVTLPAQGFAIGEAEKVTLEIAQNTGGVLVRRDEPAAAFARRRTMLLDAGAARWQPGRYVLRLVIHPGPDALLDEPETRKFEFDVVGSP